MPSLPRRPTAALVVSTIGLLLVLTLTGCGSDPASTSGARADWDLSSPQTPRELGGRSDDIATVETLGRDGVDVHLTLPGGDVVDATFGFVTADSGGGGGPVRYVSLATTQLHDGAWDDRIDEFVERFGGDRAAIAAYLATALPAMQRGEVDPGQHFPGDPRPGYEPLLDIRPDENGVVVAWEFTLTDGSGSTGTAAGG